MKPDKLVCGNCGKEIPKGKWCSDKCRMANKRTKKPEQIIPNTNKSLPEQPNEQKPEQDDFRASLTKTDKTFYDRAMKDFGEPYYRFGGDLRKGVCGFCGAKFTTTLALNRYCSYEHYRLSLFSVVQ